MEPNKLENQMREKLNAREIQPSANAWDRLDAMLSVTEDKKPKRNFNWLSIAAGIIGFLFVGLIFYNQESTTINNTNNPVVTIKKSNETENLNQETPSSIERIINQNNVERQDVAAIVEPKLKVKSQKTTTSKTQDILKNNVSNTLIAQNTKSEIKSEKSEKSTISINPTALLASVESDKQAISSDIKSKLQIDPQILLSQVDGEIELTFRQKVIKSINKNYDSARQSLASRNNE